MNRKLPQRAFWFETKGKESIVVAVECGILGYKPTGITTLFLSKNGLELKDYLKQCNANIGVTIQQAAALAFGSKTGKWDSSYCNPDNYDEDGVYKDPVFEVIDCPGITLSEAIKNVQHELCREEELGRGVDVFLKAKFEEFFFKPNRAILEQKGLRGTCLATSQSLKFYFSATAKHPLSVLNGNIRYEYEPYTIKKHAGIFFLRPKSGVDISPELSPAEFFQSIDRELWVQNTDAFLAIENLQRISQEIGDSKIQDIKRKIDVLNPCKTVTENYHKTMMSAEWREYILRVWKGEEKN